MTIEPAAAGSPLWDQQPNESARAFEAFRTYRDMEPSERSQRKVADKLGKSGALMSRWSSTYRWVERAEAYDQEQDRLWRLDLQSRRRKAVDRHLRLASAGQQKVAQRLVNLDADALTVGEATRLLEVVTRIERDALTLGQPVTHEVTGPGGDPLAIQVHDFAQLPADRRRQELAQLAELVLRRLRAADGAVDDEASGGASSG